MPVVHPTIVVHIVRYIRQALVVGASSSSTPIERQRTADRLFDYMRGSDFKENMTAVAKALEDLRGLQEKEKQAHRRTWQQQSTKFDVIDSSASHVQMRVDTILRGTQIAAVTREAAAG